MKKIKFIDEVYGVEYHIFIGDLSLAVEAVKKCFAKDDLLTLDHTNIVGKSFYNNNGNLAGIWLKDLEPSSLAISYLAHETLHLTFDVLLNRGVVLTDNNHEPFTYYHAYLVRTILNKFI